MNIELKNSLKEMYLMQNLSFSEIPDFMNQDYLTADNQKYMNMYNWMSRGYDIVETVVGRLRYGNQINQMRRAIMEKLEWRNSISVLYVSIGTGKDLEFIPAGIDRKSISIFGADISAGMLKKCRNKYEGKLNISLVQCCAEDLPFKNNIFDIVFHVGGINFFNDKQKAVDEMIRTARPGSRLLIADETNDLIENQYRKSRFSKKYFTNASVDLGEIENLVPEKMTEKKTEILWNGKFYCMTFRKNEV